MAWVTHSADFHRSHDPARAAAKGVGAILAALVGRMSDRFAAHGQRDIDREFALILARSGGRITDSMEREMMWKVLEPDWVRRQ